MDASKNITTSAPSSASTTSANPSSSAPSEAAGLQLACSSDLNVPAPLTSASEIKDCVSKAMVEAQLCNTGQLPVNMSPLGKFLYQWPSYFELLKAEKIIFTGAFTGTPPVPIFSLTINSAITIAQGCGDLMMDSFKSSTEIPYPTVGSGGHWGCYRDGVFGYHSSDITFGGKRWKKLCHEWREANGRYWHKYHEPKPLE